MTDRIEYQLRFNIDDTGDFSLLIAYAGYNFKDYHHRSANNHGAWNLRVGRQFIAITREDWMFPQDTQGDLEKCRQTSALSTSK